MWHLYMCVSFQILNKITNFHKSGVTPLGTSLLTELSPSWEAANCVAIQEIPSNFKEPEGSSPPWVGRVKGTDANLRSSAAAIYREFHSGIGMRINWLPGGM
jgi:hypothetical protein